MSINEIIISAVEPVIPVCVPDNYLGEAEEYCVFNASEYADCFGDDIASETRYTIQLHYYLPLGQNPRKKRELKRALEEAGFTSPDVINASDDEYQHWVLESEWC